MKNKQIVIAPLTLGTPTNTALFNAASRITAAVRTASAIFNGLSGAGAASPLAACPGSCRVANR
jgi:hypothetical protein